MIRALMPNDNFEELTTLLHRAYAPLAKQGLNYEATQQPVEKTEERCGHGHTIVAVKNQRLIGTLTVNYPKHTYGLDWYEQPGVTSFHQFAVDPDHQGSGIGNVMLRTAEKYCLAQGLSELAFDTSEKATDLIAWYLRHGYRHVDEAKWPHTNYKSLIFSKTLSQGG